MVESTAASFGEVESVCPVISRVPLLIQKSRNGLEKMTQTNAWFSIKLVSNMNVMAVYYCKRNTKKKKDMLVHGTT